MDIVEKPSRSSAHQACCAVDAYAAAAVISNDRPHLAWETTTERDLYSCHHARMGTGDAGRQAESNQPSAAIRSIIDDEVYEYGNGAASGDSIFTLSHDVPIKTSFLDACREAAEAFSMVSCAPGLQGCAEAYQNDSGPVSLSSGTEAEEKQITMPEPPLTFLSASSLCGVNSMEKQASPQRGAADAYTAVISNHPDLGRQAAMGGDLYSCHVDQGIEDMGRQALSNEPARPARSRTDEVNKPTVNEYGDRAAAGTSIHDASSHDISSQVLVASFQSACREAAEAFDLASIAPGNQDDIEARHNNGCLSTSGTGATETRIMVPEPTVASLHQDFKPPHQPVPLVMASLPTNTTQTSYCSDGPDGRADHMLIDRSDEDCQVRESSSENAAGEYVTTTDADGRIAAKECPNPSSEAADLMVAASSATFMTTSEAAESENDSLRRSLLRDEESCGHENFDEGGCSCLDDSRSSSTFSLPPALYQESVASIAFSHGDEDETALEQECSDVYDDFNAYHEHEVSIRECSINEGSTADSGDEDDNVYLDNNLGHGWSRFSITASADEQCPIINEGSTVDSGDEDDGIYLDNNLGHGWSRFSITNY